MTEPELDGLTVVLLLRPTNAVTYPEEELARIQDEHVAYQAALRSRGAAVIGGPFVDQPDERLRGMTLFRVGVDEAAELMRDDPAVRAGRLEVQVFTWLYPKGLARLT